MILFAFCLAFMCGTAAPLALSLCMEGFSTDKGSGSAMQSFVKMFFTGIALFLCNFVELHHFIELITIFFFVSIAMAILYYYDLRKQV